MAIIIDMSAGSRELRELLASVTDGRARFALQASGRQTFRYRMVSRMAWPS
jgi:hypothetical protein